MNTNNIPQALRSAKATSAFRVPVPTTSGDTVDLKGRDWAEVFFDTNSSFTALLPSTANTPVGTIVVFGNAGTGTITIQNPSAVTLGTAGGSTGRVSHFILSPKLVWVSLGGDQSAIDDIETALTGTGRVGVPLTSISKEEGTQMIKQATTVTGIAQLSNKNLVILIPANSTAEAFAASIPFPTDLDVAADNTEVILDVVVSKNGALDTLTLDAEIYVIGSADASISADLYAGAAVAITQGLSTLSFAVGVSDDISGTFDSVDAMAFVLTLGGTNDGDIVYIHSVSWRYPKKMLTS